MTDSPPRPGKPGTACLGCRRRKLKCSREQSGCINCTKADLPCVYPAPDAGIKRKRGPYKKDKPARERHLEDLVRYLEPRITASTGEKGTSTASSSPRENPHGSAPAAGQASCTALGSVIPQHMNGGQPQSNSEELVKDALIALTKSSITDNESRIDPDALAFPLRNASSPSSQAGLGIPHPPLYLILEYWNIFIARVDPLMKLIHCPTFAKKLFNVLGLLGSSSGAIPASFETMLFTVYFAAVRSCTPRECKRRFGEDQSILLQLYGRVVEQAVERSRESPELEVLQALVIYLTCVRRQSTGADTRALYNVAVQMAEAVRLHEDPIAGYTPFDAEMRRRLWWAICSLESRGAEDGGSRPTSIMGNHSVQLPANLNDNDLDPRSKTPPHPRAGVTQMTWPLLRWEIHRFAFRLWTVRRRYKGIPGEPFQNDSAIRNEQEQMFQEVKARLEAQYIQYLHDSRPYDWMCATFVLGMLIKARVIINNPEGFMPCKDMPTRDRMALLQASVDIIQGTHILGSDQRISDWSWYYRGFVQWNCFAIVLGELGQNTSPEFSDGAWAVVDPILAHWDVMYETNRGDAAWDHVDNLIRRARHLRKQRFERTSSSGALSNHVDMNKMEQHPTANLLADPLTARLSLRLNPQQFTPLAPNPPTTAYQYGQVRSQGSPTPVLNATSFDPFRTTSEAALADIDGMVNGFDGLEGIDFEAFDEVFGDGSWQFPDMTDPPDLTEMQFG